MAVVLLLVVVRLLVSVSGDDLDAVATAGIRSRADSELLRHPSRALIPANTNYELLERRLRPTAACPTLLEVQCFPAYPCCPSTFDRCYGLPEKYLLAATRHVTFEPARDEKRH